MSLKITLAEMRAAGARAVLVYCRACGHGTRLEAERWPDDVRLSDLEPRFTCKACGARGADVRPDYNSAQRGEGALYRT
ncbi:zinc ribbon domain-containing protein [Rhodopseudomonas faecalis]|nr:zinc ribbon domain-containing protein [Rhodopseudomonas faecalis]